MLGWFWKVTYQIQKGGDKLVVAPCPFMSIIPFCNLFFPFALLPLHYGYNFCMATNFARIFLHSSSILSSWFTFFKKPFSFSTTWVQFLQEFSSMHCDVYYYKFMCSLHWYLPWIYWAKMFQALTITTLMINYLMMNINLLNHFNVTINSICFLMFFYICLFNITCLFFHIFCDQAPYSTRRNYPWNTQNVCQFP